MGQRGEFRGEYRLGVTAGELVFHSTSIQVFNQHSKDIFERIKKRHGQANKKIKNKKIKKKNYIVP